MATRAERIREYNESAQLALEKEQPERALQYYEAIAQIEPSEPDWARKIADCHRRLGDAERQIEALSRAAELYATTGFLLKAIAMCRVLLALDPHHTATQLRLAELHGQRAAEVANVAGALPQGGEPLAAPREPVLLDRYANTWSPVSSRRTPTVIPPGLGDAAPLESMPLGEMAGTTSSPDGPTSAGVVEIDLDLPEAAEPSAPRPSFRTVAATALRRTPLFDDVDAETLRELIGQVDLVEARAGSQLLAAGEPADSMYVVVEGRLSVRLGDDTLATLAEGDFFGEIGLLSLGTRQADVWTEQDAQLLRFDRKLVVARVRADRSFLRVLLSFLRERLVHNLLATSDLFRRFDAGHARDLARRFKFVEIRSGTRVIAEGTPASGLYLLLCGEASARTAAGRTLGTLRAGDVFGEMSLLHATGAVANVDARAKCYGLYMPAAVFRETIMTHPAVLEFVSDVAAARGGVADGISDRAADERVLLY